MIGGAKGIGIGIDFGIPNQYCRATSKPYIEKDVLDSLRVVASAYGKSNDDADRSIVKNLVDASNPFIISNAAFKLNSGFGEYKEDFTSWRIYPNIKVTDNVITTNGNFNSTWFIYKHSSESKINEMNIKVSGIPKGGKILYFYISDETANGPIAYTIPKDGIYHLPESKINNNRVSVGFTVESSYDWNNIRIEQIPSFEGAFVTDGIDDLITSTKTVQEMLGGSTEFTAVSMIHLISPGQDVDGAAYTNYIRTSDNYWTSNRVSNVDKTGIYGYSFKQSTPTVINNILGDKGDYTTDKSPDTSEMFRANFSVEGFKHAISGTVHASSVAWYWTIIANKVLTTDQINQVIAYFNLDRTLKPDILCDVKKQGITNDNHAEFGDKLIDFSGNGRDIQLNNIAWKGDSGIGKYEVDFLDSSIWNSSNSTITSSKIDCKNAISHIMLLYYSIGSKEYPDIPSFKVIKTGADIDYSYIDETGAPKSVKIVDGVNILPASHNTLYSGSGRFCGFGNPGMGNSVTITQIPSHAGALCLDGVNDFGKVTGMPIYKDYTFIIDRQIIFIGDTAGVVASKSEYSADATKHGAFIFEYLGAPDNISTWSFYKDNGKVANTDFTRGISYQSTYSYNGKDLTAGTSKDSDKLWLGTMRDRDSRFFNGAIYSLMSFPYSMSEFLIERQLKKHKLGTLYPDMVEFRPIVKSNVKWDIIEIWQGDKSLYRPTVNDDKTGIYLKKDSTIGIYIEPKDADEVTKIVVNGTEYTNLKINSNGFYYVTLPITKSPQKINITIDEYIRYEDIVQPYPSFVKLENLDRTYTWGDKLKVGDTIRYNSSVNLLEGAYTLKGQLECNGVYVYDNNQHITVAKEMIFAWTNNPVWSIDNNEPKCILSPRLLRIPNSSYKILGYIPDISGHGNNGKINNSAYEGMSGVNGYPVVFGANKTWANESNGYVTNITSNTIHITNVLNAGLALLYSYVKYNGNLQNIKEIPPFKIEIKGLEGRSKFVYKYLATSNATKETNLYLGNGTHELPKSFLPTEALINDAVVGFSISPIEEGVTNFLSDITIKVLSEYEGAYCLDGVDDFVTIPTTVGGKQVLMKVNWDDVIANAIIYDQRGYPDEFAIYNADKDNSNNPVFAYQARNTGQTYIDGILNSNIKASELKAITHNITITNKLSSGTNNSSPTIGSNKHSNSFFTKMALYDFMLFDDISTDDKILELNKYAGIEGAVWGIITQLSNSTLISNETLIKNE